jgi:muramoyltetrapeptide carboxypeptidase
MVSFTPLQPGDTIGIFTPSSYIEGGEESLKEGIDLLHSFGFKTYIHPQTSAKYHQSAGTNAEKIKALHDLLKDENIKAIFAARGGQRAMHILPHIDTDLVKQHPKPVIGFSDVTSLLNYLYPLSGSVNWHAPVLKTLHDDETAQYLKRALCGEALSYTWQTEDISKTGSATGHLIGGNLSVLQALIGTPYSPDFQNAILVLEDVGEEYSGLDRALCHLKYTGLLNQLNGIIFGTFSEMQDTGQPFGFSFADIIQEHTADLNIPIAANAPFGHTKVNYPLPIGHQFVFQVESKDAVLFWNWD